jgi:arabinofuranan 3-O-arabinosyltransferase
MISIPPAFRAWPGRTVRFLLRRGTRRFLAWLALVICTAIAADWAWGCYDEPARSDGNYGHATIDFGGQWLMGRMLVTGNAGRLYDRFTEHRVLEEAYPAADSQETRVTVLLSGLLAPLAAANPAGAATLAAAGPRPDPGDAHHMLDWLVGGDSTACEVVGGYLSPLAAADPLSAAALVTAGHENWRPISRDDRLGGPLYPPLNAFLYAPLGLLPVRVAYRVMQAVNLALTFGIALLAHRITGGRVWWQVAAILLMGCPGYSGALNLAQNSLLTLFVLMLGWRQLQLGRPGRAGVVWGLMAFKPVWAAAFFLVPLLTRRWRMAAAMVVTGAALSAATLPLVGWHTWVDWVQIGSKASDLYATCESWIFLSRDLIGVPRRYLLTFTNDYAAVDDPRAQRATAIGLGLWLAPLAVTVAAMIRRGPRAARVTNGPQAAFVLFGSWLACYHFMYYDVLLAYLPCCLLYAEPRRVLRRVVRGMPPGTWCGLARSAVVTALLICLSAIPYYSTHRDPTYHFPPWDTLCVVFLWLWCDLVRGQGSAYPEQLGDRGAGVGGAHERLSDEDGVHARGEQFLDVGPPANTALTHQADAGRDGGGDLERVLEPGDERP